MAGGERSDLTGRLPQGVPLGADTWTRSNPLPDERLGRSKAAQTVFGARRTLPFVTITTASGARCYAIHPGLWISGALLAACLAMATICAGLYMAFRDNLLEIALNRPMRMEQAYEDRIAALRSEIDRINSRQLLDQDAFEAKIANLVARQEDLRAQESRVASLLSKAHDENIQVRNGANFGGDGAQLGGDLTTRPTVVPVTGAIPRQPPSNLPISIESMPLRATWLFGKGSASGARSGTGAAPGVQIASVEAELDRMKATQTQSIETIAGSAEMNARTIERVIGRLGLRMADNTMPPPPKGKPVNSLAGQVASTSGLAANPDRGVGGPLVPILDEGEILARAEAALTHLTHLKAGVGLLPLGSPINGSIEVTSPFGERPDPFLGVAAMHTGIDFRAGYGDPVTSTAAGIVTEASRQGGYGNLIEIDHGNGIATRYGHLSQFAVIVGQKVKAGQIIGYIGSTGRSTAPHLHYETRVSGVAVNPDGYLQAGNQLRSLLN